MSLNSWGRPRANEASHVLSKESHKVPLTPTAASGEEVFVGMTAMLPLQREGQAESGEKKESFPAPFILWICHHPLEGKHHGAPHSYQSRSRYKSIQRPLFGSRLEGVQEVNATKKAPIQLIRGVIATTWLSRGVIARMSMLTRRIIAGTDELAHGDITRTV
jgi:hypothetical protein